MNSDRSTSVLLPLPRRGIPHLIAWTLGLMLVGGLAFVGEARADPIAPSAIRITDGDTIRARGHAYRLVGFDTPEISSRRREVCAKERDLGERAKARLVEIVSAGRLNLEEVRCSCPDGKIADGSCNFGRKCGILKSNGRSVGDLLIKEGLARSYHCQRTTCPPQQHWPC
jgi:endonuclease YncB( thermonuclease family)